MTTKAGKPACKPVRSRTSERRHADRRHGALVEARLAHIVKMMRQLEWRTGESGPKLAKKWRLSMSAVEKLSAEASHRVRAELSDPAALAFTVRMSLDTTLRAAMQDGDRRSVIRAAGVLARIVGSSSSIIDDPRIAGLWTALHAALEDYDRMRDAFLADVVALTGGALPASALPSAHAHVRDAVKRYEAEIGARRLAA